MEEKNIITPFEVRDAGDEYCQEHLILPQLKAQEERYKTQLQTAQQTIRKRLKFCIPLEIILVLIGVAFWVYGATVYSKPYPIWLTLIVCTTIPCAFYFGVLPIAISAIKIAILSNKIKKNEHKNYESK